MLPWLIQVKSGSATHKKTFQINFTIYTVMCRTKGKHYMAHDFLILDSYATKSWNQGI